MNVIDILDRLPFELAARLESDPFFVDIPVVVAVKGNVAQEYQRKQAVIAGKGNKTGVAVIVLQIVANDMYPGLPGGPMKLKPAFQVIENVELNVGEGGTGKSARKVARQIIKNMKIAGFRGIIQALTCDTPAIEPVDVKELGDGTVSEQVNFVCQEFSDEQFLYCLPPRFVEVSANQVALTSSTPGAQIWYTTDDSFPYPGDGTKFAESKSQLYAVGQLFTIQPDTKLVVRAVAHLPGYIDSSIERATLSLQPQ